MELKERESAEAKEAREREMALKEHEILEAKKACKRKIAEAKEAREQEMALKERKLAEAKTAHERVIQNLQLHQGIKEKKHVFEMERLAAEQNAKPAVQSKEDKSYVSAKVPKLPAFDGSKDEMDSFLLRFERYANAQKKEDWATSLSALLKGKALDVNALMPVEEALNYMLKAALLKRYELTEEGFKRRHKKCRPDSGETFQRFTSRIQSYFTRWIDISGIKGKRNSKRYSKTSIARTRMARLPWLIRTCF